MRLAGVGRRLGISLVALAVERHDIVEAALRTFKLVIDILAELAGYQASLPIRMLSQLSVGSLDCREALVGKRQLADRVSDGEAGNNAGLGELGGISMMSMRLPSSVA